LYRDKRTTPDMKNKVPKPPGEKFNIYNYIDSAKIFLSSATGWMILYLCLTVVATGACVFMALVGMVTFKTAAEKTFFIEVNSQILNTIFTLAAISNHPLRFRDLLLFIHSQNTKIPEKAEYSEDIIQINYPWYSASTKGNLLTVLLLLNLNCLAQYPICVAMWGYPPETRNNYIIGVCLPVSFIAGTIGGILNGVYSKRFKHLHVNERRPSHVEKHDESESGDSEEIQL